MKIILNSDVLRTGSLIKDALPEHWLTFFKECTKKKCPIIIPQTVGLEFDRLQSEYVGVKTKQLSDALSLLDDYHVSHGTIDPSRLIFKPNIVELIRRIGTEVIVENPTYEDFVEAHKRACLHEAPGSVEKKSDEMRDLIIWVIAIRTARKDGRALLVSNDKIHSGSAGDKEAASAGLIRVRTFGEALGFFEFETPAGSFIKLILESVWKELLKAELPLEKSISTIGIHDPVFVQKLENILEVSSKISLKMFNGNQLSARIKVLLFGDIVESFNMSAIEFPGVSTEKSEIFLRPRSSITLEKDDYLERLQSLRNILGGQQ